MTLLDTIRGAVLLGHYVAFEPTMHRDLHVVVSDGDSRFAEAIVTRIELNAATVADTLLAQTVKALCDQLARAGQ